MSSTSFLIEQFTKYKKKPVVKMFLFAYIIDFKLVYISLIGTPVSVGDCSYLALPVPHLVGTHLLDSLGDYRFPCLSCVSYSVAHRTGRTPMGYLSSFFTLCSCSRRVWLLARSQAPDSGSCHSSRDLVGSSCLKRCKSGPSEGPPLCP